MNDLLFKMPLSLNDIYKSQIECSRLTLWTCCEEYPLLHESESYLLLKVHLKLHTFLATIFTIDIIPSTIILIIYGNTAMQFYLFIIY